MARSNPRTYLRAAADDWGVDAADLQPLPLPLLWLPLLLWIVLCDSTGARIGLGSGDGTGVYEPIHGSAHDITGKGIANPLASILSAALLLDISFGMKEESELVISAVDQVLKAGYRTIDIADATTIKENILGTEAMGQAVLKFL